MTRLIKIISQIKNQEKLINKIKFFMENMQIRAKDQLLSIEEPQFQSNEDPFLLIVPPFQLNSKSKLINRIQSIQSSRHHTTHHDFLNLSSQNSKQILKSKLKKLLQNDPESPKMVMNGMKTIDCLTNSKHQQKVVMLSRLHLSQQKFKKIDIQKRPLVSLQRQNLMNSQRSLLLLEPRQRNIKSLFEEQNRQVRKFIKKKMEEKKLQKEKKILINSKVFETIQKAKFSIRQKKTPEQNKQDPYICKKKLNNLELERKGDTNRNIQVKERAGDKQNLPSYGGYGSKVKEYQEVCRKLRSLLF